MRNHRWKNRSLRRSDMKNLIQEACQGPVRDAVKQHGSGVASLQADDLRPVVLRDFQARLLCFGAPPACLPASPG
jgi:hypothetical protein